MTDQTSEPPDLFKELKRDIARRTKRPIKHPSFIIFFIIAVLGFSALGIWLELYAYVYPEVGAASPKLDPLGALRTAVITFFPAVAGTAAMQLIWADGAKHFRSVAFLTLFIFLVAALWIFPANRISTESALFYGFIASLVSVYVWWVANADQIDLLDKINPSAPLGGENPEAPLTGDYMDFQH